MSVHSGTNKTLENYSHISHTRTLSPDNKLILHRHTMSNTLRTEEPTYRSQLYSENVNSTQNISTTHISEMDRKLIKYQTTIAIEEENLKRIEEKCNEKLAKKLKKKEKITVVNQKYEKAFSSLCLMEREKERTIHNIISIQAKIAKLEECRIVKKREKEILEVSAKKHGLDGKFNKFLSQLQKQQNENDLENNSSMIFYKNRVNVDSCTRMSFQNERLVHHEKLQHKQSNRKKALKMRIEKEFGLIKHVEHEKIKQAKIQDRLDEDL